MQLTDEHKGWLAGDQGPALQWAMKFNESLGHFFDARKMVPITSAHFAPDTRMMGQPGKELLKQLVEQGARACVPSTLDPCTVDFGRAAEFISEYGMEAAFVEEDREIYRLCAKMGFRHTFTCINYQSVKPPGKGDHLAWGDTGAAISANSIFGARTNFDGGPSALASAITGYTPAYGFHLDEYRRGNLLIKIECEPAEIADWGAIARWAGQLATGYETVPVFYGEFARPNEDMLKQLGVALASYGSHAMFHVVGITPEAPTLEAACGGLVPAERHVIDKNLLRQIYDETQLPESHVDLVVFAAPQLSLNEVRLISGRLEQRKIHANTKLILAVDPQVKASADQKGYSSILEQSGAELSSGTCFYPEAPLLRRKTGWNTVVTNSAKLVNTLASAGYNTALRRIDACIDAAISGRLSS